jgi:uridylate kinase
MVYNRVLIKLSGEALGNDNGKGISDEKLDKVARQIGQLSDNGIECVVVIGAGNFWRGKYGYEYIERTTSDHMGMLATVLNALALQAKLESHGKEVRLQTAIEMKEIAETYIRRKAMRHLEKKRIVIFACGTGNPYFTTDTAAALRALETECDVILLAKNVDGVYDKDPKVYDDAKKYDELTYLKIINDNLKVMDMTAITMCMENKMPLIVFALSEENSILKAARGEQIGTVVK